VRGSQGLASIAVFGVLLAACAAPAVSPATASPIDSPTISPTLTRSPRKSVIGPGDKIGEMVVEREESKNYYWIMDSCNFDWTPITPNSQTAKCTVPELSVVGIGAYWWADKLKFESNWEAMSWELYVDDHPVALDEFGWSDLSYFESGMEVTSRCWNVVLRGLSAGKHTIRSSWSMSEPVDDGMNTYAPGKYEFIAELTVTEKPVYPVMPPVAEPGQHAYASNDAKLDFLLYVPATYGIRPEEKWPLIVYLHDAELRGTNPSFIRKESLPRRLDLQKDLPFLVLSPSGDGDWDFWSTEQMMTSLLAILEEVQALYSVDEDRIYLTGEGMGGNGVWAIGLAHPDYFAALAPLGGYVYPFEVPQSICNLKDVPVWAFHGGNDFMVPVEVEQDLVDALNACGGNAKITVIPSAVIPTEAYADPGLYDWMLSTSAE
jgi:hypothetical protein